LAQGLPNRDGVAYRCLVVFGPEPSRWMTTNTGRPVRRRAGIRFQNNQMRVMLYWRKCA
jgi:hypothetical protein